jgi:hypothetical protein
MEEQFNCINILFETAKTAQETHELLKTAFNDTVMRKTQASKWFS